jgi:hypothetical protein
MTIFGLLEVVLFLWATKHALGNKLGLCLSPKTNKLTQTTISYCKQRREATRLHQKRASLSLSLLSLYFCQTMSFTGCVFVHLLALPVVYASIPWSMVRRERNRWCRWIVLRGCRRWGTPHAAAEPEIAGHAQAGQAASCVPHHNPNIFLSPPPICSSCSHNSLYIKCHKG